MLGLRHRVPVAVVERGRQPQPARQFGRKVRQDVAEHVGGEDHVEPGRVAHQQGGGGIDQHLVDRDVGVIGRNRAHGIQEQPVGQAQDVGLVDHRDAPRGAAFGQGKGRAGDGGAVVARDLAHRDGKVGGRHHLARARVHVAIGIEAFEVLAHHDHVQRVAGGGGHPGARARGADVGIMPQRLAQHARGVQPPLRDRGIGVVRHRAQDDAVDILGPGAGDHRVGNRRAVLRKRGKADVVPFDAQRHAPRRAGRHRHLGGGGGDFGSDPVPGKGEKAQVHRRPLTAGARAGGRIPAAGPAGIRGPGSRRAR